MIRSYYSLIGPGTFLLSIKNFSIRKIKISCNQELYKNFYSLNDDGQNITTDMIGIKLQLFKEMPNMDISDINNLTINSCRLNEIQIIYSFPDNNGVSYMNKILVNNEPPDTKKPLKW